MPADPTRRFPRRTPLAPPADGAPRLLVVVDTEEEFDWGGPFDRKFTTVESMKGVTPFQELCDSFGVRPTYVITLPIATQETGYESLVEFEKDGRAQIGAHQHPWVCPPFEEEVNAFHSYPGNLPEPLERAKLAHLTGAIEETFGFRPTIYKAGRYGFGENTAAILEDLGYEFDLSPCGPFDSSKDGGPDDTRMPSTPFRFGTGRDLVCLPATGGFVGSLPVGIARPVYTSARRPALEKLRAAGILARLRLVERVLLSPEGYTLDELKRLARTLVLRGEPIMTLTLHTPSLAPGYTWYTRDQAEVDGFLARIRGFLEFFANELGGKFTTPRELRDECLSTDPSLGTSD